MGETFVIILGCALILGGLIGCVLPSIPGPPLNYLALILLQYVREPFSTKFLIYSGLITAFIFAFDFILPAIGAKLYGVSKRGIWSSVLGMFLGMIFFPPLGIFPGILIGAVIGELSAGKNNSEAFKAGLVSFIFSIFAVVIKWINAAALSYFFIKEII